MNEDFNCDVCNSVVTDYINDLYHYSGILNGKLNTHIHICATCNKKLEMILINFDDLINK